MNDSFIKFIDLPTNHKRKSLQNYQSQSIRKTNQTYCCRNHSLQGTRQRQAEGKCVNNLSSKSLTSMEKTLLQKGPKFAISPPSTPEIDYIAATKHICDSLGENNLVGKTDCMEYYAKVKDVLTKFTNKPKVIASNITKEEKEPIHNLRKYDSHMVPTAEKGVAPVVIDKDIYINEYIILLNKQEVYCECQDQAKSIHAKVPKQLLELINSIRPKFKDQYTKFHPPGDNNPPDSMVYQET